MASGKKPKKKDPRRKRISGSGVLINGKKFSFSSRYRTIAQKIEERTNKSLGGVLGEPPSTLQEIDERKWFGLRRMKASAKKAYRSRVAPEVDPNRPWPNPKKVN